MKYAVFIITLCSVFLPALVIGQDKNNVGTAAFRSGGGRIGFGGEGKQTAKNKITYVHNFSIVRMVPEIMASN
jgi:hypothetical protein